MYRENEGDDNRSHRRGDSIDWRGIGHIEVVTKFVFLGALITKGGLCEKAVRSRI